MMDEQSLKRLSAAVRAAWWTILIFAAWLVLGWIDFLLIMHIRPSWLLTLWGGGEMTWPEVHTLIIWFFAASKVLLFVALLVTIWLSLWLRGLKRA